jgi:hypothetical protein
MHSGVRRIRPVAGRAVASRAPKVSALRASIHLRNYARWVSFRPRDRSYDARVRDVVPRLSGIVAEVFTRDSMEGGCVAASGMICRMLDRLGIWSFGVTGSLTLEVERYRLWRGLQFMDDPDFPGAALGHAWVIAPPYRIVDGTIALQRWTGDPIAPFIPAYLAIESEGKVIRPVVGDVVSARARAKFEALEGRRDPNLHYRLQANLAAFGKDFPALEVSKSDLKLRYVPMAINLTNVPLEQINVEGQVGRPAIEIWEDYVASAFKMPT